MMLLDLITLFNTLKNPVQQIENGAFTSNSYSHHGFILRMVGQLVNQGFYAESNLAFLPADDPDFLRQFGAGDCRGNYHLGPIFEQTFGQVKRRAVAFNPTDPNLTAFYYVEELNLNTGVYQAYIYAGENAAYRTENFGDLFFGLPVPESDLLTNFTGVLIPNNVGSRQKLPFNRCTCTEAVTAFLETFGRFLVGYFETNGVFIGNDDYYSNTSGIDFLTIHGFGAAWKSLCDCDYYPYFESGVSDFGVERAKLILYARSSVKRSYVLLVHKTAPNTAFFGISQTDDFTYTQNTAILGAIVNQVDSMTVNTAFVNATPGFSPFTGLDPVDCVQSPIHGLVAYLELQPCQTPSTCEPDPDISSIWVVRPGDNLRFYMPFPDDSLFPNNVDYENSTLRVCDAVTGEFLVAESPNPNLFVPFEVFTYESGNALTELFFYVNLLIKPAWQGRCLKLCLTHGNPPVVFLCSQPFEVKADCEAKLVRIRCNGNAFGYPYAYAQATNPFYTANNYQQFRLRISCNQPQHAVESVLNKTSNGVVNKLYARLRETVVLETDYYNSHALALIAAVIQHDVFEVYDDAIGRWQSYTASDGLTITWPEGYPQYPLAKAKALLYKTVDNRYNNFC